MSEFLCTDLANDALAELAARSPLLSPLPALPPLLSTADVAAFFNRTPRTIRLWVQRGRLVPVRIGCAVFFRRHEIERLVFGEDLPDPAQTLPRNINNHNGLQTIQRTVPTQAGCSNGVCPRELPAFAASCQLKESMP
jgi:hypothetical protein